MDCRNSGLSVREWCEANHLCPQTYYRWQRRLFEMAQAQQERGFVEVTPAHPASVDGVAVTVRIDGVELDIHNGADAATVEAVLRAVKSC